MPINVSKIIEFSSACLTPIIGISMLIIAYQQWQTNERKRRQELFDKRWAFYLKIKRNYDLKVMGEISITDDTEFFIFSDICDEANFLFGMDIADHINKINDHIKLHHFNYTWLIEPFEKYLKIEQQNQVTLWRFFTYLIKMIYRFLIPISIQHKIIYFINKLFKKTYSGELYIEKRNIENIIEQTKELK